MPKVVFPDGQEREYPAGTSLAQVAADVGGGGAQPVAAKLNGRMVDLSNTLQADSTLELVSRESPEGLEILRHTTSHVMAHAVRRLYPNVKLAIGPAIQDGFYYDFDLDATLNEDDLARIEQEMQKIVAEGLPIVRVEMTKEEARRHMLEAGECYKVEMIDEFEDQVVSFYRQGEFIDLCRGPHLANTAQVGAFKLLSVAGAYWRGNERNKMLQRVYGTAFPRREQLLEHLRLIEEAQKRDHRKLGRDLDLFSFHEEGPGFPFFHPKGMVVWNALLEFWRQVHRERNYGEVRTPIILRQKVWEQSGHWDHFQQNMYFTRIDDLEYAIKPMNCPGGMLIYKTRMRSYRDLPLRWAELGVVHRHERSGVLHGLLRVRQFTQDDAHIFMLPEQMIDEIVGVIDLIQYVYGVFRLPFHVELSTRPASSIGTDEMWERATGALRRAMELKGLQYKENPGEGAFYGPKIDFHIRDALQRTHQCATIQLDFAEPEQFDLTYVDADGQLKRPVMIHRVVLGSIERFLGILLEHYGGALPAWLSPVQVKVLPISQEQHGYAQEVSATLEKAGIRVECDLRSEKIGYKIREATLEKVPYMLVVGAREAASRTVAVRHRSAGDKGAQTLETFLCALKEEIQTKR